MERKMTTTKGYMGDFGVVHIVSHGVSKCMVEEL